MGQIVNKQTRICEPHILNTVIFWNIFTCMNNYIWQFLIFTGVDEYWHASKVDKEMMFLSCDYMYLDIKSAKFGLQQTKTNTIRSFLIKLNIHFLYLFVFKNKKIFFILNASKNNCTGFELTQSMQWK